MVKQAARSKTDNKQDVTLATMGQSGGLKTTKKCRDASNNVHQQML